VGDIRQLVKLELKESIQEFRPGDTVRVQFRIREGDRERVQSFQGLILRRRRGGPGASFTVRRVASGVGVERVFPLYSPLLDAVEVVRHGRVRRARLYYQRGRFGRAARVKERSVGPPQAREAPGSAQGTAPST
jgi:large subunit ribosomal protein L19